MGYSLFRSRRLKRIIFSFQCDSLRKHLDIVNDDLKFQDRKYKESQRNLQLADEDLVSSFPMINLFVCFLIDFHYKKIHFRRPLE